MNARYGKQLLGIALLAGVGVLLAWTFLESRHELAQERERERPLKIPPRVSRTKAGEVFVHLDAETQALIGLETQTVSISSMESPDPRKTLSADLPSAESALSVWEAEYERVQPMAKEHRAVSIPSPAGSGAGVVVPHAAVVWFEGKTWVYVQRGPDEFMRHEVLLNHPTDAGWSVISGLASGDTIVAVGAAILLSEELKSQIQILEEGEKD